jgi:glycerol-3-phosphate acyltransferase PlsY
MPPAIYVLFSALIGYLFGAVPVGYLLVRLTRRIDLRKVGSGRTGGTNTFRAAGLAMGILTSVADVLKAACAIWLVQALFQARLSAVSMPWIEAITGVFTVAGHNWSVFLGWVGGAGTGPNVGWSGALWLPIVPIGLGVVLIGILVLGYASVASLAMAAIVPLSFIVLYALGVSPYDRSIAYIVGGVVAASLVVWALRPNIKRLVEGRERKVGPRARSAASGDG